MVATMAEHWHGIEVAGRPCLAMVNTLDWRGRAAPVELLVSYAEFLRFSASAGIMTRDESQALLDEAGKHPRGAQRALGEAIRLRETMASILRAVRTRKVPPPQATFDFDAVCRVARAAQRLDARPAGFTWTWRSTAPKLSRPAWSLALDGADLLVSLDLDCVRTCADVECGWVFLDTSRNRARRWCSMKACGNRNKVRRFYRRSLAARRR